MATEPIDAAEARRKAREERREQNRRAWAARYMPSGSTTPPDSPYAMIAGQAAVDGGCGSGGSGGSGGTPASLPVPAATRACALSATGSRRRLRRLTLADLEAVLDPAHPIPLRDRLTALKLAAGIAGLATSNVNVAISHELTFRGYTSGVAPKPVTPVVTDGAKSDPPPGG